MRLQKISIFYLVAFFALLSSIGNIWSGENSLAKSTHWPSDGDRVEKKHYEYLGVVNDSLLTWDFSNAVETGTSHSMQWINIGDSVLVKKELGMQLSFIVKHDSIIWRAYENPLLELRDSIPVALKLGGGLKKSYAIPFCFNGTYCKNNYVLCGGTLAVDISDSGTLILPNDTIENVVRVTQRTEGPLYVSNERFQNMNDSIDKCQQINHIVVIDRWFSPVFKYELVENVSDVYYFGDEMVTESYAAFICPPDEQKYCMETLYAPSHSMKRTSSSKGHKSQDDCSMKSENNSDNNVSVNFNGNSISVKIINSTDERIDNASGLLCDQLGRVWKVFSNIDFADGEWQTRMSSHELPRGNYILYLSIDGDYISKKLIIQ